MALADKATHFEAVKLILRSVLSSQLRKIKTARVSVCGVGLLSWARQGAVRLRWKVV